MEPSTGNLNAISKLFWIMAGFLALFLGDTILWEFQIFGDLEAPDLSYTSLVRSLILFVLTGVLLWILQVKKKPQISYEHYRGIDYEKLGVLGVIAGTLFIIFLFVFFPHLFSGLTYEDSYIENASFLLLFLGSVIFGILFYKYFNDKHLEKTIKYSLILLSLTIFVIAMEEVSWFQRQLKVDVQSMELFAKNEQNEMNFHNFASIAFEYFYYTGTYVFFTFIPFIFLVVPFFSKYEYIKIFVPRSYLIIIGSITSAFNFEKWDSILTQISFFSSIWILLLFLRKKGIKTNEQLILGGTLVLIIVTQLLFLFNGTKFTRYWEVTEYKEFYIAILLFLYSVGVASNLAGKIKTPGN